MKTQAPDTSPEVEKVYFDLLRRKTPSERLQLARELTASSIARARRRIAHQHPEWSEQEVALHWATLMYGEELIGRVREYLKRREALK